MSEFLGGLAEVLANIKGPLSIIAICILVVVFIAVTFFTKSSQRVKIATFLVVVVLVVLIIFKIDPPPPPPPSPDQYLVTVTVSSITVNNDSEYQAPGQIYFELEFDDNVFRIPDKDEFTVNSGTTINNIGFKKTFKILKGKEVSLRFKGTEIDSNHSDTPEDDLGHITPRTFTINDGFSKQIHEGSSTGHYNVKISIDSEVITEADKSDSQ